LTVSNFFDNYSIDYFVLNEKIDFDLKGFECDAHWNDETHKNIAKILKKENIYQ